MNRRGGGEGHSDKSTLDEHINSEFTTKNPLAQYSVQYGKSEAEGDEENKDEDEASRNEKTAALPCKIHAKRADEARRKGRRAMILEYIKARITLIRRRLIIGMLSVPPIQQIGSRVVLKPRNGRPHNPLHPEPVQVRKYVDLVFVLLFIFVNAIDRIDTHSRIRFHAHHGLSFTHDSDHFAKY